MLMRYAAVCLDGKDGGVIERVSADGRILPTPLPPPIPKLVAIALEPLAVRLSQLGLAAGTGLVEVEVVALLAVRVDGRDVDDPVAIMLTGDFERV